MPKLFFLFFIAFLPFYLFAQQSGQDVVYLKNGSVIRGKITEYEEQKFVKILVSETNELFFPVDEVKSISHNVPKLDDFGNPKKKMPIYYKHKGIYVNTFGSFGFGGGTHGDWLMTNTNVAAGYMFNRYVGAGIGTGSYWYHASGRIAPFYLEARGEFLRKKRMVPVYYGRIGYGTVIGTSGVTVELRGGFFWNVGIGYKEYTTRKHQWTYTLGLQSQQTYQKWTQERTIFDPNTNTVSTMLFDIEGNISLRRIVWGWGMMF